MTDDDDATILDAWIPTVRIERVPRDLQIRVLQRLIRKLERSDPRRPKPTRRRRKSGDPNGSAAKRSDDA
jgi:hypothetical protein